ncbi:hypothetical protein [Actinacidiphila alni]|uniref:hypothetical protein n=1 Tax=Actinacidiphila alni TaxID=380248 RepID=UPI003456F9A8
MRLFSRGAALPPTRYGYQPPRGAIGLRWICTADDCGRGGPESPGDPWPRRCPGCHRTEIATFELAQPWQHAAKRAEIDARLGAYPRYGDPLAARADDLVWQVEEALLSDSAQRAEDARRALDHFVAEQQDAGAFTGYEARFWLVEAAMRHGAHALAARELIAWHEARPFDDPESNDDRADCRTLADRLIEYLEDPATGGSPHREELWTRLCDLMPRIAQVATARNTAGFNRLRRQHATGNREEEMMVAELRRLAEADRSGRGGAGTGLPPQAARRLEILGRDRIAGKDSGVDGSLIFEVCLQPFMSSAPEDIAQAVLPVGGWPVYGASRMLQDLRSHDDSSAAYLRVLDAGLDFLHTSGVGAEHLNGWDQHRWNETRGPGTW